MSCFNCCCRSKKKCAGDEEALLPEHNDETVLQRKFYKKLRIYQMMIALWQGYMPSNEQMIVNIRILLASDLMDSQNPNLSDWGQRTVQLCKQWLHELIELLRKKNDNDQIQDIIWCLTRARLSIDGANAISELHQISAQSDVTKTLEGLKTIWGFLMVSSDFRIFLEDIGLIGRQIFADSAQSFAAVAENAAREIRPSEAEAEVLQGAGADSGPAPDVNDLQEESNAAAEMASNSLEQVVKGVGESVEGNTSTAVKETLVNRLKQSVMKLRQQPSYTDSINIVGTLLKHYAAIYSQAAEDTIDLAKNEVHNDKTINIAIRKFWSLISTFGDQEEWAQLQKISCKFFDHARRDPGFETLMENMGAPLESMLLDPNFFDHADEELDRLKVNLAKFGENKDLMKHDIDTFLWQLRRTLQSVAHDDDIRKLSRILDQLIAMIFPQDSMVRRELFEDSVRVFIPVLIRAIQYIPLPRIEVATPVIDLLMENLVIEPGRTINNTSFLPFRLRIEAQNNMEIRKARFRTHSSLASLMTIKMDGLTLRAEELGYWMRIHSGLSRLTDEGIASFQLDQRGMDIHVNVEIGRDRTENLLTLRDIHVRIHHLNYSLRKSKFAWLAWIMKPVIRPILRKILEREISSAISQLLHTGNRELLYARERLRATRIADPESLGTFLRAIIAHITPEEDPDIYTSFGVKPSENETFRGRYAPGSIVKLWEEEGHGVRERVQDFEIKGWRNEIFDVHMNLAS